LAGTRTQDQRLKRPLLYRLSYQPIQEIQEVDGDCIKHLGCTRLGTITVGNIEGHLLKRKQEGVRVDLIHLIRAIASARGKYLHGPAVSRF
jgi:hypothetical protein